MLLMGKLTISMAIFNSFLYVYQRLPPFPRSTSPIQQPQGRSSAPHFLAFEDWTMTVQTPYQAVGVMLGDLLNLFP